MEKRVKALEKQLNEDYTVYYTKGNKVIDSNYVEKEDNKYFYTEKRGSYYCHTEFKIPVEKHIVPTFKTKVHKIMKELGLRIKYKDEKIIVIPQKTIVEVNKNEQVTRNNSKN